MGHGPDRILRPAGEKVQAIPESKAPVSHSSVVAKSNAALAKLAPLNLQELRLLAFCLAHYDSRSPENRVFSARVQELVKIFPSMDKDSAYRVVKETIHSFNRKAIHEEYIREDGKRVSGTIFWFSSFEYVHDDGEFVFRISQEAMPYLLDLKNFFYRYNLKTIYQFKSPSTWKLYEGCKAHKLLPNSGKWAVSVARLREFLDMADKYPRWESFKKMVLMKAVADINAYTDIDVEVRFDKVGRQVEGVVFFITAKEESPPSEDPAIVANIGDTENDVRRLMNEGLNQKNAETLSRMAREAGKDLGYFLERVVERWGAIPESGRKKSRAAYIYGALNLEFSSNLLDLAEEAVRNRLKSEAVQKASAPLWVKIKAFLAARLEPDEFATWIEPLSFRLEGGAVVLSGPNSFFTNWVAGHYREIIQEAAASFDLEGLQFETIEMGR